MVLRSSGSLRPAGNITIPNVTAVGCYGTVTRVPRVSLQPRLSNNHLTQHECLEIPR
jgi:hypothetical protein